MIKLDILLGLNSNNLYNERYNTIIGIKFDNYSYNTVIQNTLVKTLDNLEVYNTILNTSTIELIKNENISLTIKNSVIKSLNEN